MFVCMALCNENACTGGIGLEMLMIQHYGCHFVGDHDCRGRTCNDRCEGEISLFWTWCLYMHPNSQEVIVLRAREAGSLCSELLRGGAWHRTERNEYWVGPKSARMRLGIKPCTNHTFVYYGSLCFWSSPIFWKHVIFLYISLCSENACAGGICFVHVNDSALWLPFCRKSFLLRPHARDDCVVKMPLPVHDIQKFVLSGSQKCTDASPHQAVHEWYVCVLRIVTFLIVSSFLKIMMVVYVLLSSKNCSPGHLFCTR